jgi:glutamate-1-semialdehyde 2,1-aminomutase
MIEPQFTSAEKLFDAAQAYMPAGVGAGGRFNGSLGRPMYFVRGNGAHLYGLDGREYLDFNLSHGATILGYNHPATRRAVEQALDLGVMAACETEYVARLAQRVCEIVPCAQMVRFATSGMEATALTIRIARAATGRDKIVKFEGHFHGFHNDVMFNTSGAPWSGPAPIPPRPDTAGMPRSASDLVIVLPWNDLDALEQTFARHGDEIAGVICEPINYDSGCIPADRNYLTAMRALTQKYGALLLFDEVLSAFRTGVNCAQGYYGVIPDLCAIAKAIANGVPIALIAGRRDLMMLLAPLGPVAHSGTYADHLFGILAALACLDELTQPGFYDSLLSVADRLHRGMNELFRMHNIVGRVQGLGCRFGMYFGVENEVRCYKDAAQRDVPMWHRFVRGCFERGIYFQSIGHAIGHSGISAAHTPADIDWTLNQMDDVFKTLRQGSSA